MTHTRLAPAPNSPAPIRWIDTLKVYREPATLRTAFGPAMQDTALDAFRIGVFGRGADAAGRSNRRGHR